MSPLLLLRRLLDGASRRRGSVPSEDALARNRSRRPSTRLLPRRTDRVPRPPPPTAGGARSALMGGLPWLAPPFRTRRSAYPGAPPGALIETVFRDPEP